MRIYLIILLFLSKFDIGALVAQVQHPYYVIKDSTVATPQHISVKVEQDRLVNVRINQIVTVDHQTQEVNTKRFDQTLFGNRMEKIDSNYYTNYQHQSFKSYGFLKLSSDFDTLEYHTFDVSRELTHTWGYSYLVEWGGRLLGFWTIRDHSFDTLHFESVCIVADKNLQSFDTIDALHGRHMWVVDVRVKGNFLQVHYVIPKPTGTGSLPSHGYFLMNNKLEIVEEVTYENSYKNTLHNSPVEIDNVFLDNGDVVRISKAPFNSDQLLRFDSLGRLVESHDLRFPYNNFFRFLDIKYRDGYIYVLGNVRLSFYEDIHHPDLVDVAYIAKIDLRGNVMWDRLFYDRNEEEGLYNACYLHEMDIAEDGSIYAAGYVTPFGHDLIPSKSWLMHLSPEGCLDDGWCDLDVHMDGEKPLIDSCDMLREMPVWQYSNLGLFIDCEEPLDMRLEVVGDTIIGQVQASILGMMRNDTMVPFSKVIMNKEAGRYHFYQDEKWWLAYDMSNTVTYGDTIAYYTPRSAAALIANPWDEPLMPQDYFIGPYYYEVYGGWPIQAPNGFNTFYYDTRDITFEIYGDSVPENIYFTLDRIYEYSGPFLSLFGYFNNFLGDNPCVAPTGCFANKLFSYEFQPGVCNLLLSEEELEVVDISTTVYPNPTSGILHLSESTASHIEVYDLQGRQQLASAGTELQIDLSPLPSGVYIVVGYDDQRRQVIRDKVVKW